MSGPKCNQYRQNEEKQRLERERLRREQEEARARRIKEQEEARARKIEEQRIVAAKELWASILGIKDVFAELNDEIKKYASEGVKIPKSAEDNISAIDRDLNKAETAEKCITSDKNSNDVLQTVKKNLESKVCSLKQNFKEIQASFERDNKEKIEMGFTVFFENIGERNQSEDENKTGEGKGAEAPDYSDIINYKLSKMEEMEISDKLRAKMESIKLRVKNCTCDAELRTQLELFVTPLEKDCVLYDRLIKTHGEEYNGLVAEYEFLASQLGKAPKKVEFSENAISILLDKISKLEKEVLIKREKENVERSIDATMFEMGYGVVGSRAVEKRNGASFKSVLYRFSKGLVVNVTYSDGGSVTMEIAGTSNSMRVPNEDEVNSLVEDMEDFCGKYSVIKEKLCEKGLEITSHDEQAPAPQYAKIIDTSKYDMKEHIGDYSEHLKDKREKPDNVIVKHVGEEW